MHLDRVTFTGADESVTPDEILRVVEEYPTIKTEWALLLSKGLEGTRPRYPALAWMEEFIKASLASVTADKTAIAGHLQGRWLRDMSKGKDTFFQERDTIANYFQRYQLNFHGDRSFVNEGFHALLLETAYLSGFEKQFIIQMDGINEDIYHQACAEASCQPNMIVPLFDLSAGAGIVPESWPRPIHPNLNGYAGGLGPETIQEQWKRIEDVAGDTWIWIDMERRIRSEDDRKFELDKCRQVLDFVVGRIR